MIDSAPGGTVSRVLHRSLRYNYPTAVRGTGQGFTYNTGRAVGAVFPTLVGFLADSWGVGGALVFGAIGYGIAALALLGLPETRGKELA